MTKEDDFFAGFDPPVLKVDPIGPQGELLAKVAELEAQLRQSENKLQIESELHAAAGKWVFDLQTQLRQEREHVEQLQTAFSGLSTDKNATISTLTAERDAFRKALERIRESSTGFAFTVARSALLAQIPKEKTEP